MTSYRGYLIRFHLYQVSASETFNRLTRTWRESPPTLAEDGAIILKELEPGILQKIAVTSSEVEALHIIDELVDGSRSDLENAEHEERS